MTVTSDQCPHQRVTLCEYLQKYAVHLAWRSVQATEHCSELQPMTQVSCWCIGEYGNHLRGEYRELCHCVSENDFIVNEVGCRPERPVVTSEFFV